MGYRWPGRLRTSATFGLLSSPRHLDRFFYRHTGLYRKRQAQVGRRGHRTLSRSPHHLGRPEEGPSRRPRSTRGNAKTKPKVHHQQGWRRHEGTHRSTKVSGMQQSDR
ncbi:hypothetical protein D6C83_05832 [Aureobasidium pullulans]|uniref:Uncharacterized protein n=1 Tax=Aureobasidium pullulans TaxID=5580 RepID=A0A4T0CB87_AURPU|nr:hypothetical protein D6C83_05832 [Aureobasidium pullulans]